MMLTKWADGPQRGGDNDNAIHLRDGDDNRILSIEKLPDGNVLFSEQCDNYFGVAMPKEDAKSALLEALEWLDQ